MMNMNCLGTKHKEDNQNGSKFKENKNHSIYVVFCSVRVSPVSGRVPPGRHCFECPSFTDLLMETK